MTQKDALAVMHLPDSATREDFDRAYQRLVKCYPPAVHPENFRQIEGAYNFLTSLPYLLERLFAPQKLKISVNKEEIKFSLYLPPWNKPWPRSKIDCFWPIFGAEGLTQEARAVKWLHQKPHDRKKMMPRKSSTQPTQSIRKQIYYVQLVIKTTYRIP